MSNVIIVPTVSSQQIVSRYEGLIPPALADVPLQLGLLGSAIFQTLIFNPGQYLDSNNKPVTYLPIELQLVLITAHQKKNIIKTYIQGAPGGSVKEYIADGDWDISISGTIPALGNQQRDFASIYILQQLGMVPAAIGVSNIYLNSLGIQNIVIEQINFPQNAGGYSQQPFTISAVSDTPVQLQLNTNNAQ